MTARHCQSQKLTGSDRSAKNPATSRQYLSTPIRIEFLRTTNTMSPKRRSHFRFSPGERVLVYGLTCRFYEVHARILPPKDAQRTGNYYAIVHMAYPKITFPAEEDKLVQYNG
jgi:hypothetical protein